LLFTGGRDGAIFCTNLASDNRTPTDLLSPATSAEELPYTKLHQHPKQMITCLTYDEGGKLWYGTPNSSFTCLDVKNLRAKAVVWQEHPGKLLPTHDHLRKVCRG
jgi:hypothetical protein